MLTQFSSSWSSQLQPCRATVAPPGMSRWQLGSMVRITGLYPQQNPHLIWNNPLIRPPLIDPNFRPTWHPVVQHEALFGNFRWTTGALFLLFLVPWSQGWSVCGELTRFQADFSDVFLVVSNIGWRKLGNYPQFPVFGGWLHDDETLKKTWRKKSHPCWLQRIFVSDWVSGNHRSMAQIWVWGTLKSVFHSEYCFCWTKTTPGQMFQRTSSAYPIIYIFV